MRSGESCPRPHWQSGCDIHALASRVHGRQRPRAHRAASELQFPLEAQDVTAFSPNGSLSIAFCSERRWTALCKTRPDLAAPKGGRPSAALTNGARNCHEALAAHPARQSARKKALRRYWLDQAARPFGFVITCRPTSRL